MQGAITKDFIDKEKRKITEAVPPGTGYGSAGAGRAGAGLTTLGTR